MKAIHTIRHGHELLMRPKNAVQLAGPLGAREIQAGVIAAPLTNATLRILNMLGYPVIRSGDDLNLDSRVIPYKHQIRTVDFLIKNPRCCVLNEIGTGKTLASLWAADWLMKAGLVKRCLVLSTLSTLERVWGDEIFKNLIGTKFAVLHGTAAKRKQLLGCDSKFCIINYDGFKIIGDEAMGQFDLLILDEAATLRNPSTMKSRIIRKWVDEQPEMRVWAMTGTPTPNGPPDAWALAKLVGNAELAGTYSRFRDFTMMKAGMYRYVPRPESTKMVRLVLQPSIRFTRDDCLDLPSTTTQNREVKLTAEQSKIYKEMMKHFMSEISQGETLTAANEMVKMRKLLQISSGVVYTAEGGQAKVDCSSRLKVLREVIDEAGGKVICFAELRGVINRLYDELKGEFQCAMVHGDVKPKQRNEVFSDFQTGDNIDVLLAHPGTMSHGLTLTAAKTIVWYAPIASNDIYTQANGRVERIGKTHSVNVVHIESTALERSMYKRLAARQALQGVLLEVIRQDTGPS